MELAYRLALIYDNRGDMKKQLEYCNLALIEAEKKKDSLFIGKISLSMGWAYKNILEGDKALACYIKAEKCFSKDSVQLAWTLIGKGNVFESSGNFKLALHYYFMVLKQSKTLNNNRITVWSLTSIGNVYFREDKLDSALFYYKKSLAIPMKARRDSINAITAYGNVGLIYCDYLKKPNEGIPYLDKGVKINENLHLVFPGTYLSLSLAYIMTKDFKKAHSYIQKAIKAASASNDNETLVEAYNTKIRTDSALGFTDSVYADVRKYIALNDSMRGIQSAEKMAKLQTEFEVEKKDNRIKILSKDQELKNEKIRKQTIVTAIVLTGLVIICILFFILCRYYIAKKKANVLLHLQKKDIEIKRVQLAEKNEKINDSIVYAQRIQEAILPASLFLPGEVNDYFIFYKPKDIVSGDFYWRYLSGDELFFATIDCTGHGVPGAMMSMLSYELLETVVKEYQTREPAEILSTINTRIIQKFNGTNMGGAKDGMDITLCRYNLKSRLLTYAGAKNSFFLFNGEELKLCVVDRQSIGYIDGIKFNQAEVTLQAGNELFLFTDGFADQKGGPEGKKYMNSRFEILLRELAKLSFREQKSKLEQEFAAWKGTNHQRDDVMVVGIKI